MTLRKIALTWAGLIAGFMLAAGSAIAAEDCPRGDLDERYCDVDGDLTADTPTDPSKLIDKLIYARRQRY